MKKIIPPIEPDTNQQDTNQTVDLTHSNSFKKRNVPNLTKFNIHTIENLKEKLDTIKMSNRQHDFTQSINEVLNLYDIDDLHYNENIVFFVMQEIEKYLLKPKAGISKTQVCVECCKKYFNDDPDLVIFAIKLLMPKLHQVKMLERQARKIIRFFSKIIFSQASNNAS
jgi:hypothetical protein